MEKMIDLLTVKSNASFVDPDYEGTVAQFPWLPGYLVKFDEGRIRGGEIMKQCVADNGLNLLLIPEQTRYLIPESHHHLSKLRSLCIARKIEGRLGKDEVINQEQARQLIDLIKISGAGDLKWRNLVHCADGRISIIDTETFLHQRYGLDSLRWKNTFDPQALALVKQAIEEINNPGYGKAW